MAVYLVLEALRIKSVRMNITDLNGGSIGFAFARSQAIQIGAAINLF